MRSAAAKDSTNREQQRYGTYTSQRCACIMSLRICVFEYGRVAVDSTLQDSCKFIRSRRVHTWGPTGASAHVQAAVAHAIWLLGPHSHAA
jgi:hypothetical protein